MGSIEYMGDLGYHKTELRANHTEPEKARAFQLPERLRSRAASI